MNLTLKAVYYCSTSHRRWGRGLTIKDAKKNAGITLKAHEKNCEYCVVAAVFDNPTDAELDNLAKCITSDQISGSAKYYDFDRTEEDNQMILEKHVGWLTVEKNF